MSGGLEYESAYSLGPMVGVDDIEAATFANFVCNEDGMDPISFGATVAAAMELYEDRRHRRCRDRRRRLHLRLRRGALPGG